jgi:hypothetical protein
MTTGCTSLSNDVKLVTDSNKEPAKLLVYREGAFQAGAVSLYVGKDDKYFLKLRNDQYGEVNIDAGSHTLLAKADASPSSELQVTLLPKERLCLASKPNPKMLGAVIIPLVANMVPTFVLEQIECPSSAVLSNYVQVGL